MTRLNASLIACAAVISTTSIACPPVWQPSRCFGTGIDPQTPVCIALDWDGDCDLDDDDLAAMAVDYFNGEACMDLNCDGVNDPDDLGDFITVFQMRREYCNFWSPC